MAQKYLDLTGLGKVWAKIKGNFLDLSGTGTMTAPIKFGNYRYWATPADSAGLSIMSAYGQAPLDDGAVAGGTNYAVGLNIGGYGYHMGLGWNVSNKKLYVRGSGNTAWEEVVVSSRLSSYLPLSGGTMTGTIERQYNTASDSPVLKIGSNNKDIQIFKVYSNDATYSDTGSLFGYALKYIGSGTGVANLLRFIADNQTGTKVTALSMNQSGQIGILSDPNTSYALYVNGDISAANETISGAINVPGASNASVTTQGINFTYNTSNTAHIGLSTGLFIYSSGAITLRPNGATSSAAGSGCLSVTSSGITAEEVITAEGFVKSGGTSAQFLKADGSIDSNAYLPTTGGTLSGNITAPKFIVSGSSNTKVLLGDGTTKDLGTFTTTDKNYHMPTNAFGGSSVAIHQNVVNNGFYAADSRAVVTLTGFTNPTSGIYQLFDGNYETSKDIPAGGTGVILIDSSETTSSGLFGTYSYGYTYVSFYYTGIPQSVSMRVYGTRAAGVDWYDLGTATAYYNGGTANYCCRILNSGTYNVKKWEITIVAKSDIACKVTQIDQQFNRGATQYMSAVTKYPITQDLYGNVVAPKFVKRGGSSSEFLKADGSVDSNTYLTSVEEITTTWINSNCV